MNNNEPLNIDFKIFSPEYALNVLYYSITTKNERTIYLLKKLHDIKLLEKINIPEFEYKDQLIESIDLRLQGYNDVAIKEKLKFDYTNIINKQNIIDEAIFDDMLQDKIDQFYTTSLVQQIFTTVVDKADSNTMLKKIKSQVKRYINETDFSNVMFKELVLSTDSTLDSILQPTNIKHIDPNLPSLKKIFPTGFETQRVYIIGGATGRGKSMFLHNIVSKLIPKYNVYHFTLENSLEETVNRYLSIITQTDLSELADNRTTIIETVKQYVKSIKGSLVIKEYPAGLLTKTDIIEYIQSKISQSYAAPDVIVVDYLDLMTTYEKWNELRFKLMQIANDLKQLAQTLNCVVLTATQLNRDAVKAQTANESNISESYAKIFAADAFLTLNATEEETKKQLLRLFVAKNRIGKSRQEYLYKTDFAKSTIIDLDTLVDEKYMSQIHDTNSEDANIDFDDNNFKLKI